MPQRSQRPGGEVRSLGTRRGARRGALPVAEEELLQPVPGAELILLARGRAAWCRVRPRGTWPGPGLEGRSGEARTLPVRRPD